MSSRWDETWCRLRDWTNGQGPSERLAAQFLEQLHGAPSCSRAGEQPHGDSPLLAQGVYLLLVLWRQVEQVPGFAIHIFINPKKRHHFHCN